MGFLSLGIDSFIACLAVGCLIDRRRWLPYAALFGLCDSLAFLLGVTLHWEMRMRLRASLDRAPWSR
jgi:hypothetical protein